MRTEEYMCLQAGSQCGKKSKKEERGRQTRRKKGIERGKREKHRLMEIRSEVLAVRIQIDREIETETGTGRHRHIDTGIGQETERLSVLYVEMGVQ